MPENSPAQHHVVIVGGGFAGLFAAQALGRSGYDATLLDKRNFHTFQPRPYQVASGMLTTGDVCVSHRVLLRRRKTVRCLMSTAVDADPARRRLIHEHGELGRERAQPEDRRACTAHAARNLLRLRTRRARARPRGAQALADHRRGRRRAHRRGSCSAPSASWA